MKSQGQVTSIKTDSDKKLCCEIFCNRTKTQDRAKGERDISQCHVCPVIIEAERRKSLSELVKSKSPGKIKRKLWQS